MPSYFVDPARITWEDGNPVSDLYRDIYWHRGSPLREKIRVFVEPLLSLIGKPDTRSQVTVCELGFGFGLNCLLTADAWKEMPSDCQLNFVAIEKHPVDLEVLRHFLGGLTFRHSDALINAYPPPFRGQHVIWLAPNIRLLLIFDEVAQALGNLDARVDCWYLDGFAPARNESMWQEHLYRKMYARSRPGARLTTYSAAGAVRRGLDAAGFTTEKSPGFGRKKEMLSASAPGTWQVAEHGRDSTAIIGAGLAGLFCYEALRNRHLDCTLIDRGTAGPSSIPQLTVLPQLARAAETRYRFSLAASQFMRNAPGYHETGLHWIGRTDSETRRLQDIAGLFPDHLIEGRPDGAWYCRAGWLSCAELADRLQPEIKETGVALVSPGWHGLNDQGEPVFKADHLILATGHHRSLLPDQLMIRAIRGQAIEVGTSGIDHVINSLVTIFPTTNGRSIISGTYEPIDDDRVRDEDTRVLIDTAKNYAALNTDSVTPWTGIRAVSRDRLPVIGPAPDWSAVQEANRVSAVRTFQPGLHYCTAFASRGATHARLCAEHTVSKLLGEPAALGLEEQSLLSPARFTIRDRNAPG